ncbi:MAG: LytR C-terminal domain-containing protein [Patescibacteria group bacterium]|nr:LytR C-terminal domain-containing protein [Patescibacteria group bacterium]
MTEDPEVPQPLPPLPELKPDRKPVFVAIGVILSTLILAGLPVWYFYSEYSREQQQVLDPNREERVVLAETLERVGKLILLPENEQPTFATVTRVEDLRGQPFFENARNGDIVLAYNQANKAILYRPSTGKIIDASPIRPNEGVVAGTANNAPALQSQVNPTTPPAAPPMVRVAVYNGTAAIGLAARIKQRLREKVANLEVISTKNAINRDYTQTLVIDLTGNGSSAAQQMATIVGGVVAQLPEGEDRPDADFLVIGGQDVIPEYPALQPNE